MRNALAVTRGGAGVILDDEVYDRPIHAKQLRNAVAEVLADPRCRQNAQRLGQSLKEAGGYVRVADVIEATAIGSV
jgi:UDP:flavonoid glycosyltransferase YjiC (YdhE family)